MMGFDAIGNFFIKKAVTSLVKIAIDKFNVSATSEHKIKLFISTLEEEIFLETKKENQSEKTVFTFQNLDYHYKLAKAYEQQQFFEDMSGFSKIKLQEAVHEIEVRQSTLAKDKDKATIYNFLADFYVDKDYDKFATYNLEALEYKDKLEEKEEAKIYMRQALAEMNHVKYEDALINIQSAIDIEPYNNSYLGLKVQVLIFLNRLDSLEVQIEQMIVEHEKENNRLSLADDYILLAKYYEKNQQENKASENFKKAYDLIEKLEDEAFAIKKIYLLSQIANIDGDKLGENEVLQEALNKAEEAIRLDSLLNLSLRHRLDFIEMANALINKGVKSWQDGKYPKALSAFKQALSIRKKVLGEEHLDTAISYKILALFYFKTNRFKEAYSYMKKAVEIQSRVLPQNHPDLQGSKKDLETITNKLEGTS